MIYTLWKYDDPTIGFGYALFLEGNLTAKSQLGFNAILVARIDAPSLFAAVQQKHELLGWSRPILHEPLWIRGSGPFHEFSENAFFYSCRRRESIDRLPVNVPTH